MNKNKMFSILIAVLALGGAVAGTLAFFTARRTVSTNRFEQGTLDLSVDGDAGVDPFVIENLGTTGTITGTKTWTIVNTGTLPGRLLVRIKNLENNENGCNDQELETEPGCGSDTIGELGGVMNLRLTLDGSDQIALNGTEVVSSYLADADEGTIGNAWKALPTITLQANDTVTVKADWSVSEDAYGNEIQSDDLTFDIDFRLIQQIEGDITN